MTVNPKTTTGQRKFAVSTIPANVIAQASLALMEGARKYGRHNYRVGTVEASVYYDAAFRHLSDWWEGTDTDPDSGLHHVVKALATLIVLADAIDRGAMVDDRPPPSPEGWQQTLNDKVLELIAKYPDSKPPITGKP